MSEEKIVKARVQNKRKTEAEWYLDVYDTQGKLREDAFKPLKGELIIFAADWSEDNSKGSKYDRFKFGDGVTNVMDLPFSDKDVISKIEEVKENIVIDITDSLPIENINNKALYRLITATFIHNRHVVDNSICYCVETLPEIGEPATDGNQSIRAYYNMSDKQVYGYLNETLASAFGVSAGWYDAGTLLTAQGWSYAGVISDINSDPNDSVIRVLLNTSVYIPTANRWKELTNDELNKRFPEITELGHWVYTVQNREGKEPEYAAYPISYSAKEADEETPLYHIPLRVNGRMQSLSPKSDIDVATKSYVDAEIQNKAYGNAQKKYHTTNIYYYTDKYNQGNASIGLHQNAEESESEHIPLRQKSGLMTANVPENAPDNAVVNKGYVKNELDSFKQTTDALDTQKVSLMRTFDGEEDNNRVYYIKSTPIEVSAETLTVELKGNSIMVCAVASSDSDYYDSSYSFINEDGSPMKSAERGHPQYLPTPIVTISEDGTMASWEAVEGAIGYKYLLGSPVPYSNAKKGFADSHNRVYVDRSNGKGINRRITLSPNPFGPRDPDPEDFAQNKMMDSVPLRMDDGFLRVPVSDYGKSQPAVGDDNYDENQRAMSKKYIDTAIQYAITEADTMTTYVRNDATTYTNKKYDEAKKYSDNYNPTTKQYSVNTLTNYSNVLQVVGNSTDYKANQLITTINSMEGTGKYSCFSTDIKCSTNRTSGFLSTIIFGSFIFGLSIRVIDNKLYLYQYNDAIQEDSGDGNTGGTGATELCSLPIDEWFNLKIKYYQNGKNSTVSVYVNDNIVVNNAPCYYNYAATQKITEITNILWRYYALNVIFQFDNISLIRSDSEIMPYTNKVATFEDGNITSTTSGTSYVTHSNNTNSGKLDMISVISESLPYIPLANENGELHGSVSETSGENVLVNKGYFDSIVGDIQSVLEAINVQINTFEGGN